MREETRRDGAEIVKRSSNRQDFVGALHRVAREPFVMA
jgi:hypothetical protein